MADESNKLVQGAQKAGGIINEFKKFILRGNVIDMAVGIIIGSAFTAIVTALVNDIIMPMIGVICGGVNFSGLNFRIGDAVVCYGSLIQAIFNFFIIAVCVFIIVQMMNRFHDKRKKEEAAPAPAKPDPQIELLTEIRDLLKDGKE